MPLAEYLVKASLRSISATFRVIHIANMRNWFDNAPPNNSFNRRANSVVFIVNLAVM
jgi:hypothetical protein